MSWGECALNGSGPQAIAVETIRTSQNSGGNYSTFRVRLWYLGKGWGSWTNNTQYWSLGSTYGASGSFTIPSGSNDILLHEGYFNLAHDANGNLGAWYQSGSIDTNHSTIGDGSCGTTEPAAPRLGQAPGAPGKPTITDLTPISAVASWSAASRGRADIDYYLLRWHTNPNPDAAGYVESTALNLSRAIANLLPGTTYYAKVYAHNGDGYGSGSAVTSFTTLPSTPPTLVSVTPDATGRQATVVMTPPSGIASVNSYTVQNRVAGGAWATVASGSANPTQTITGLVPGQTYEWKVLGIIGTYTTPESNVITRTQPQPNASPGSYFDGNTPDSPSTDYQFTGAAGGSTSTATTKTGGAVGWLTGAQAVAKGSGGMAVSYQVAGGIEPNGNSGAFSVTYAMLTPATGNGFRMGVNGVQGYADVTVGGAYMGSIWVSPSRARVLAAMWVWYNAAGAEIGTSVGIGVSVAANTPTRITVLGSAPANAVKGAVVAVDPAGSLKMDAGDSVVVDAAMASTGTLYPYFDGDTTDTAQFIYAWEAGQYISASSREEIPQAERNPLQDPFCDPIPVPPGPPIIEDDCVVPVGSWRRTWYELDAQSVPAHLAGVPTVTLSTYGEAEQQVRIRWYANPDDLDPLAYDASSWEFEQIISYIPPCSEITLDGVSRRVWATVGDRTGTGTPSDPYQCVEGIYPTIPADSLLYGTGGVPATWPLLSCGIGWLVSLDTPLDAPAGNLTVSAELTVRE